MGVYQLWGPKNRIRVRRRLRVPGARCGVSTSLNIGKILTNDRAFGATRGHSDAGVYHQCVRDIVNSDRVTAGGVRVANGEDAVVIGIDR